MWAFSLYSVYASLYSVNDSLNLTKKSSSLLKDRLSICLSFFSCFNSWKATRVAIAAIFRQSAAMFVCFEETTFSLCMLTTQWLFKIIGTVSSSLVNKFKGKVAESKETG